MNLELPPGDDATPIEYDLWSWHTEGEFPKDQPPEHGYVHIGMFLVWLIDVGLLDPQWSASDRIAPAVRAIAAREGSACALREPTGGRFASDMLTAEGQAFTGAYYAPEYGYLRDWNRVFGRPAARYAVPEDWQTYDRIGPVIERRYHEWQAAGRPELMPMPRVLEALLRLAGTRRR
jgi:hypothetical protein